MEQRSGDPAARGPAPAPEAAGRRPSWPWPEEGAPDGAAASPAGVRVPLLAAVLGAAFTACVYLLPGNMLDVAYRSVSLRVGAEAFGSLAALAFAYLVVGPIQRGPLVGDYLLAAAFVVLAVENLLFLALPTAHDYGATSGFSAWSSAAARVLEGVLFVAASLAPPRRPRRGRGATLAATLLAAAAACGLIAGAVATAGRDLPVAIDQSLSPVAAGTVLPAGSGAIALLTLLAALLFAAAAARLAARARADDPLGRWLAIALVAAALAACNFALFPTEYSQWVDAGDIFEFLSSLALVVGVAAEVRRYWHRLLDAAVLEERRRIARDLHDGLAQELAFIAVEADGALGSAAPDGSLERIAAAAARATTEVRLVVAALIEPLEPSVILSLHRTAREVTRRHVALSVEAIGADLDVSGSERDALQWITREAVANAVRHGHAAKVRLRVSATPTPRLRVVDNGCGFDERERARGFGMAIMRERAARAGGSVTVRSLPGLGTAVQIVLPSPGRPSHTRALPPRARALRP